jgi:hypothetical protein
MFAIPDCKTKLAVDAATVGARSISRKLAEGLRDEAIATGLLDLSPIGH